jgi:hypothetical protein
MTNNPFTRGGVLRALADELDPEPGRVEVARRRYEDLGEWLKLHAAGLQYDVLVYPQGSGALGTTNQNPFTLEFDIDLVVRVEQRKDKITQEGLNLLVNGWLGSYTAARIGDGGPLGPLLLHRGKRAWTLEYGDGFHMDLLPVVPDLLAELDATGGDPSWLTDKELRRWQATNPKGFAEWFFDLTRRQRQVLAKEARVEIEDLPVFGGPQTDLQLAVRLLKRHRDFAFEVDPTGVAPPSVVVTALASLAFERYRPQGDLGDVLETLTKTMPEFIRGASEELVIPNPTCLDENYADRYKDRADKSAALQEWLWRVQHDAVEVSFVSGPASLVETVDAAFGSGLGARVAKRLGRDAQRVRSAGSLRSGATGALGVTGTGRRHKDHTFYGGPEV